MVDSDDTAKQLKSILFAAALFLTSAYWSFQEFKYLLFGKTAPATIEKTHETRERRTSLIAIYYTFTEADGTVRRERDDVPIEWEPPGDGQITVEYLPGVADSSRLLGHGRKWLIIVFFGCLAWGGFSIWRIARMANEPAGRHRRRR